MATVSRRVIGRESNVLRVDFQGEPDPPEPKFPGAAALRRDMRQLVNAIAATSERSRVTMSLSERR